MAVSVGVAVAFHRSCAVPDALEFPILGGCSSLVPATSGLVVVRTSSALLLVVGGRYRALRESE